MNGKLVGLALIVPAIAAGAAIYWLQVYAFYDRVEPVGPYEPRLVTANGESIALHVRDYQGIDADSSPQRHRACFRLPAGLPQGAGFTPYPGAEPLTAPRWFDCFDAAGIHAALADGRARAYLSAAEVRPGVDRVMAVFADGRAYVWQQLNATLRE